MRRFWNFFTDHFLLCSSQSNTSDSILSTTNSSIKPTTTNTSEFLNQREIFCLTPEEHSSSSVDQKSEESAKQTTSSVEGEADKENFSMAPATNALKVAGRQTNNSLSSISENIFLPVPDSASKVNNIKSGPTTPSAASPVVESKGKKIKKSKKDKVPTTEVVLPGPKKAKKEDMMGEDTLQIGMHKILSHVKSHRDAWPFMDPVDEEIAPRYYSIIRRLVDLDSLMNCSLKKIFFTDQWTFRRWKKNWTTVTTTNSVTFVTTSS